MIVCPNCNHQNPEGSLQCENCYTPLPNNASCPNCGASVQVDATFCGQCGFNLQAEKPISASNLPETMMGSELFSDSSQPEEKPEIPVTAAMSAPIKSPWDEEYEENEEEVTTAYSELAEDNNFERELEDNSTEAIKAQNFPPDLDFGLNFEPETNSNSEPMPWEISEPVTSSENKSESEMEVAPEPQVELESDLDIDLPASEPVSSSTDSMANTKDNSTPLPSPSLTSFPELATAGATQLQIQKVSLFHVQTNTSVEVPQNLDIIHVGKPNSQIPPDIDVAGFPDSEIVSRIHADIRVEGDAYFIEDVGSSNGTYINHVPLLKGNRHRLRAGDRIGLGKGDLVTFIFQIS